MKDLQRLFSVAFVLVDMTLGFTTLGYSTPTVSVAVDAVEAPAVGSKLHVDINITSGRDIAGYGMLLIFDASALKYIETTPGDYLPFGGTFIAPTLLSDRNYAVDLRLGPALKIVDTAVEFGEDIISVDSILFDMSGQVPPLPELMIPEGEFWGISLLAAAPQPAQITGGTLATLTFEVVAAKSAAVALLDTNLFDIDDESLEFTEQDRLVLLQEGAITVAPLEIPISPTDVNRDGQVNILDLTLVASQFGKPITGTNAAADVNGDGNINILDLTLVAQNFGK